MNMVEVADSSIKTGKERYIDYLRLKSIADWITSTHDRLFLSVFYHSDILKSLINSNRLINQYVSISIE